MFNDDGRLNQRIPFAEIEGEHAEAEQKDKAEAKQPAILRSKGCSPVDDAEDGRIGQPRNPGNQQSAAPRIRRFAQKLLDDFHALVFRPGAASVRLDVHSHNCVSSDIGGKISNI
jgi:hypothetical protein